MENENVGLTDLLAGLEAEKEAIWQDKQSGCVGYLPTKSVLIAGCGSRTYNR